MRVYIFGTNTTTIDFQLRIVFAGVEKFLFQVKFTDKQFNFTTPEVTGKTY